MTYAYQWQRCSASCSNISGATGSTYTPVAADVGDTLDVTVTASNSAGNASATSSKTATIAASGGGAGVRPVEYGEADDFGDSAAGVAVDGEQRHVVRYYPDDLRVPVAALQCVVLEHLWCYEQHLHAGGRATSAIRST